jgi:adenine deaminase
VAAPTPGKKIRLIVAFDGQLLTGVEEVLPTVRDGQIVSDVSRDILKIAVVNRYQPDAPVAVAFIKNFGLKTGALASSVAHDSHNIVAVGVDDASLCAAVNAVIAHRGGLSAVFGGEPQVFPLPIAGLMNPGTCAEAGPAFTRLSAAAKAAGCPLRSPYMTLSFMALLVIPRLKIGDRGLFDATPFAPVSLVV